MHDADELVAVLEFALGDLDVDRSFLEFLAAQKVGQAVDRDVRFDEGGEDDREDGEGEAEEGEEGDGREDDVGREGLAADGREEGERGKGDGEGGEGPKEV